MEKHLYQKLPEEQKCEDDKETQVDITEDDWNTVSGGMALCTFSEFVDVNKILIKTEMRDISDIVAETTHDKDEDDEGDAAKVSPTHTTVFDTLETL